MEQYQCGTNRDNSATKPSMPRGKAVRFCIPRLKALHNLVLQSPSLTGYSDSVPVDLELEEDRRHVNRGPAGSEITEGGPKTWPCSIPSAWITKPISHLKEGNEGVEKNWECSLVSFLSGDCSGNAFRSMEIRWVWTTYNTQSQNLNVTPALLLISSFAVCKLFTP